jgi:hypothetical protein
VLCKKTILFLQTRKGQREEVMPNFLNETEGKLKTRYRKYENEDSRMIKKNEMV